MSLSLAVAVSLAGPAVAADELYSTDPTPVIGTVNITDSEKSTGLWTAEVPRVGWVTVGNDKCRELRIAVTPTVSEDTRDDLDVEFELWTPQGVEVASDTIYGFSWNPSGGPTQVALFDCDFAPGDYTLYITTEYELSTNGLIKRYLEGKEQVAYTIKSTPLCAKKRNPAKLDYVAADQCPTGAVEVKALCVKPGKDKLYGFAKKKCPKGYKKAS